MVAMVVAEKVKVSLKTAPVMVPVKAGLAAPKTRVALFAVTVRGAGVTVSAKLTVWLTPAVVAVATKPPTCVPVAVTLATPLLSVVTEPSEEKLSPAPVKVTGTPTAGVLFDSVTATLRGWAKAFL